MISTQQRVEAAAREALRAVGEALIATRFAVSLETRLLPHEAGPLGEYLVCAYSALIDVRDTLELALVPTLEAP